MVSIRINESFFGALWTSESCPVSSVPYCCKGSWFTMKRPRDAWSLTPSWLKLLKRVWHITACGCLYVKKMVAKTMQKPRLETSRGVWKLGSMNSKASHRKCQGSLHEIMCSSSVFCWTWILGMDRGKELSSFTNPTWTVELCLGLRLHLMSACLHGDVGTVKWNGYAWLCNTS